MRQVRFAIGAGLAAICSATAVSAQNPPAVERRVYDGQVAPFDTIVSEKINPQMEALIQKLLRERRDMAIDGVKAFTGKDRFLPGSIAAFMARRITVLPPGDARRAQRLRDFGTIADLTIDQPNDSWGIYYYMSALNALKTAGVLQQAVSPSTLQRLRQRLDWRAFVRPDYSLIDLPQNYYGVAFPIARLRYRLGWEHPAASEELLKRALDHYRRYSGENGFSDETAGDGRFDRYSVLLVAEIVQRMTESGLEPSREVKRWLRNSVDLILPRLNLRGEGWEYGRSIGVYGDSALVEILSTAAQLKVLTPDEERMAYAFVSRVATRYVDFWMDPRIGSVNLWDGGRHTDAYRGKHRIFQENLSLSFQYNYTNDIWNQLGYRGKSPDQGFAAWLDRLPASTFTWFSRGKYDRAILTLRDRGMIVSLPIVNGAASQHMHNPYYPVPFSPGVLQGSADAAYPNLVPQITLQDGSVLMPLAFFKDVRSTRSGDTTTVSWLQDEWDRMGGNDSVPDPRLKVHTRYIFSPGRIVREDELALVDGAEIRNLAMEFGSFSADVALRGPADFRFGQGTVTEFKAIGYGACYAATPTAPVYAATTGAMRTVISCRNASGKRQAMKLRWEMRYQP